MTMDQNWSTNATLTLPPLSLMRVRVVYRMLAATMLPAYKGALLRGGFGYAFQRATSACPPACWGHSATCPHTLICPYRQVFEPTRPPGRSGALHNLHDIPRPFVIEPPLEQKREYRAGDALEFGLVLIGSALDLLPNFLYGFAELGQAGLGRDYVRAHLERADVLRPFQQLGVNVYTNGEVDVPVEPPTHNLAELPMHAAELPADLQLTLHTPLRIKAGGAFIEHVDLGAIVQATCWRLAALTSFYGLVPWDDDYRPIVSAARQVRVERTAIRWVDWERTSTRGGERRSMKLGGLVGSASLRNVPPDVRTILLAASLMHTGKACVFGHGRLEVSHM
ncbi:CRISPR system precrRNA processing endoribonuclease RAMP protein Cas6 [Candidatus Chloroploca sp. Khr17]|uniref:CRISPR system precrRNA processing endoribonuclease RAMP protein Cas6 n=1 Tax=Candidatus Chloroploca sp. Khr17 TaxID=2496869 RepID=UPI001F0EB680|nr:CRISPR system precrRNA processing endoribonuclease RAMP protein Cas6 [Candidatus Chloroploca sp. Khr17]